MRHFLPNPVSPQLLIRLLEAAHHAPSVGYMQPWRIIRVTETAIRNDIYQLVETERIKTAQALGERDQEFMKLKVEGIRECGELLVAVLADQREKFIFGRRTLPEMDLASVSCAIQNFWLAARAEGLGMGWVSLFDPSVLGELLALPNSAKPVAILCLGHVEEFYSRPMLESTGWEKRREIKKIVFENHWNCPADGLFIS